MTRRIVVGTGYLGLRVAELWLKNGDEVYGVTRSQEKALTLLKLGLKPVVADVLSSPRLPNIPPCDTLLYSVGPTGQPKVPRLALYRDGLTKVLEQWGPKVDKLVLVSTTGVYGEAANGIVDENTPRQPRRESSLALAEAEDVLLRDPWRRKAIILRMGAIYGPGRLPLMSILREGRPLPTDPNAVLNLIFIDDAARAVTVVADAAQPPEVVNVVDGCPVTRKTFYESLCAQLKLPPPVFCQLSAEADHSARSRGRASNRVISNRRLVENYGLSFECPNYVVGLSRIAELEP